MEKPRIKGIFVLLLTLAIVSQASFYICAADASMWPLSSWTGNPETTRTITWRDDRQTDEYVEYIDGASYEKDGFSGALQQKATCRDISLDNSGAWHYEAEITGLTPGTRYLYRVGGSGGWSEGRTFMTAEPENDSFSFVFFGDIQVTADAEAEYAMWGALAKEAYERVPDMAFGLFAGDIVESGISLAQFDSFAKNAAPVFGSVPVMPTNGNHESNFIGGKPQMYLDYFALPQNGPEGFTEEFYSFDYADCHVTVLNSWVFSGEQPLDEEDYARINAWIENDLRSSNATWKIILMHHPAYAVHNDGVANTVRREWAPLFERFGVSLAFVGHQHVYSRSYPMRDGEVDFENGVTYIMGNSGQKFYSSADGRYSERVLYDVATYQLVRIDGNELTVQTYDIDGNELDYWTASPRGVMTRLMLATELYRLAGSPAVTAASLFSDTNAAAVIWAGEKGIVNGTGHGAFSPDDAVTREQAAAMLHRYANSIGADTSKRGELSAFSDGGKVSDWAKEALSWAIGTGIISAAGEGALAPKLTMTLAETAQILLNFENNG